MQKYTEFIDRSEPQKGSAVKCKKHFTSLTFGCDVQNADDSLTFLGLAAFDENRVRLHKNSLLKH